ncbi:hypothetical protein [Dyella japonica]|uniref:Uncharacterized protein n=1 Tax=Dyella japonica TaxID=231455 RepID=A0ABV2K140_9GAMM
MKGGGIGLLLGIVLDVVSAFVAGWRMGGAGHPHGQRLLASPITVTVDAVLLFFGRLILRVLNIQDHTMP